MTLRVIGAGFGRIGTLSLKLALEQLGFGPCYHMAEVRGHPGHIALWRRAWGGEDVWPQLFDGYAAAVDWPAAAFWQPLMAYYPDAKVVLSLRDGESWFKSATDTIFRGVREGLANAASGEGPADEHLAMVKEIIVDGTFAGDLTDAAAAVATYEANVAAARKAVPASRLIEAHARDGWAPLCAGLGVAVPDAPYPKVNTTAEFAARWGRRRGPS
jgi:hypothetical protein